MRAVVFSIALLFVMSGVTATSARRQVQAIRFGYPARADIVKSLGSVDFVVQRWQSALKTWTNQDCRENANSTLGCSNVLLIQSSVRLITNTNVVSGFAIHSIAYGLAEAEDTADALSTLESTNAKDTQRAENFRALASELNDVRMRFALIVDQYLLAEDAEVENARGQK